MRIDPNEYKSLHEYPIGTMAAYIAVIALMIYCAVSLISNF